MPRSAPAARTPGRVIAADPAARPRVRADRRARAVDYYGGARLGDNRYANSIVALARVDRRGRLALPDRASRPVGLRQRVAAGARSTVRASGRAIPRCCRRRRPGMLFVLDRETGRAARSRGGTRGARERRARREPWPTQPFSTHPAAQSADAVAGRRWGADSEDRAACRAAIAALRHDGPFTPPSLQGTLVMPSNIGGAHWGGRRVRRRRASSRSCR